MGPAQPARLCRLVRGWSGLGRRPARGVKWKGPRAPGRGTDVQPSSGQGEGSGPQESPGIICRL